MPNLTVIMDSFNRGELSPKLLARSQAEYYQDGLQTLTNFVAVPRGAIKRRNGFRYLNRVAIPDSTQNIFPQKAEIVITTPDVEIARA